MKEFSNEELSHLLVNKVKELKESKCQVEELNARLQDTVAQLEETQQELIAQKEHLQEEVDVKTRELIKVEKLVTIGELSARIAHDLRNPLSVIKSTTGVLHHNLKSQLNELTQEQFKRLYRAIYRMQHQLEDVLDYLRETPVHRSLTNSNTIIHDCLERILIPENITVNLPQDNVKLFCDSNKIEVVLVNLIMNAMQAIDGKVGTIDIFVSQDNEDDGFVEIKIKDSGPGIPEELRTKIFDPLFTTRQIGTGLGLPSCKNILKQHGGKIDFESQVGDGTTFSIKIPKNSEWNKINNSQLNDNFSNYSSSTEDIINEDSVKKNKIGYTNYS